MDVMVSIGSNFFYTVTLPRTEALLVAERVVELRNMTGKEILSGNSGTLAISTSCTMT